jgi:CMP-2-keto-3-deoxyoctulosonic acid synthetase
LYSKLVSTSHFESIHLDIDPLLYLPIPIPKNNKIRAIAEQWFTHDGCVVVLCVQHRSSSCSNERVNPVVVEVNLAATYASRATPWPNNQPDLHGKLQAI